MLYYGARIPREYNDLGAPAALINAAIQGGHSDIIQYVLANLSPELINRAHYTDRTLTYECDPVLIHLLKSTAPLETIAPLFKMLIDAGASLDAEDPITTRTARYMATQKLIALLESAEPLETIQPIFKIFTEAGIRLGMHPITEAPIFKILTEAATSHSPDTVSASMTEASLFSKMGADAGVALTMGAAMIDSATHAGAEMGEKPSVA